MPPPLRIITSIQRTATKVSTETLQHPRADRPLKGSAPTVGWSGRTTPGRVPTPVVTAIKETIRDGSVPQRLGLKMRKRREPRPPLSTATEVIFSRLAVRFAIHFSPRPVQTFAEKTFYPSIRYSQVGPEGARLDEARLESAQHEGGRKS